MEHNSETIAILLALQPRMTCELYEQVFNRTAGFRVVSCASTVKEALEAARTGEVRVALISATLKDGPMSGFNALQQIVAASPAVRSIILLDPNEDHLVTAAFRAGAKGVLSAANNGLKSLCRCVRQVDAGQIWANSHQLQTVMDAFSRRPALTVVSAGGVRLLTKREEQIVHLVQDGLTNRLIAKELGLSENTVRNNLFRIFDKLGVSTRVELALYAVNHSGAVVLEDRSEAQRSTGSRPFQETSGNSQLELSSN